MFLYSAYNKFTNQDIISFLKKQGLDVKEERGNRIFPVTDKSQDVLNCFEKKLKNLKNVKIMYEMPVSEILINEPKEYKDLLTLNLKTGISFPKARAKALDEYFKKYR